MFVYDIRQTLVNVFARRTAKNVQVSVENVAPETKHIATKCRWCAEQIELVI